MSESLRKEERLCGTKDITGLFEGGEGGFAHPLRYLFSITDAPEGSCNGVRIMVSVPKRNHKLATQRNLLKRRLREAYRKNKESLVAAGELNKKCIKIALIYSIKDKSDYATIENGVKNVIGQIFKAI